jgi:hypothetical protein
MPTTTIATADRFLAIVAAVSIAQRLRASADKASTSAERTTLERSARKFEREAARLGR